MLVAEAEYVDGNTDEFVITGYVHTDGETFLYCSQKDWDAFKSEINFIEENGGNYSFVYYSETYRQDLILKGAYRGDVCFAFEGADFCEEDEYEEDEIFWNK